MDATLPNILLGSSVFVLLLSFRLIAGMGSKRKPRNESFCGHAILQRCVISSFILEVPV